MRYAFVASVLIMQGFVQGPAERPGQPPVHAADSLCNTTGKVDVCNNILTGGWDVTANLPATQKFLQGMRVKSIPTQVRKASARCRVVYNNTDEAQELDYSVPADLARLPAIGLGDQDVVVALFRSDGPGNCWEAQYGTRRWTKQSRRDVQFVTVRLDPSISVSAAPTTDRRIATWTSWAISSRLDLKTNVRTLSLEKLKTGQWTQCALRHNHQEGQTYDLAFIGCKGYRAAANLVQKYGLGSRSVSTTISDYNSGDAQVRRAFRSEDITPFTASAWGRCGSFGCCSIDSF